MLNREQFLESVGREIEISKHLHSKIDSSQLGYRPGKNMRSTLELLRYLTFCGAGPAEALVGGDWSVIGKYQEDASEMPAEEFPPRMDAQLGRIRKLVTSVPEGELTKREVQLPWGEKTSLGAGLVNTTLKFLATYRLQLFDHIKASGRPELSTYNAWMGIDKPDS